MISDSLIVNRHVRLQVVDDGKIYLVMGSNFHHLADYGIQYIGDRGFLIAYVTEGAKEKFFMPLSLNSVPDTQDFFKHWNEKRLAETKNVRVSSFLNYINHCIDFVRENVDVEKYKPTYETEFIDNTDYGGGIFT